MNRIRHLIGIFLMTAMLAASASLAVSCSVVEENENIIPEPTEDRSSFQIHFNICTFDRGETRADLEEEAGSGAENFLDIDNIKYFIFDKDRKFLLDITPSIQKITPLSSNYAIYDVVARIDEKETDYFKENRSGMVDFYILVLANYAGYGISQPTMAKGDDISKLFSTESLIMKTPPDTPKLMNANDKDAADNNRTYFPMSGLQHFRLSGTWFETQAGEVPIDISYITGKDLNLLRALAKIEVIDRINMPPGVQFDEAIHGDRRRISSVNINGVMKTGRLLPTANQWNIDSNWETRQVTAPSTTGPAYYLIPPPLDQGKVTTAGNVMEGNSLPFVKDLPATERQPDKCPVYSCYVWEYSQGTDGIPTSIDLTQCPYLTISTSEHITPEGTLESTYFHRLAIDTTIGEGENTEIKTEPIHSLLRNHIYRYEVIGAGSHITVNWTLCKMDEASTDITFR